MPRDPELVKAARDALARHEQTDETSTVAKTPAQTPSEQAAFNQSELRSRARRALRRHEPPVDRTTSQANSRDRNLAFDSLRVVADAGGLAQAYSPRMIAMPHDDEGTITFGPAPQPQMGHVGGDRTIVGITSAPRKRSKTSPRNQQLEEAISNISEGRLNLPSDGLSGTALANFRLLEDFKFGETKRISGALPQDTRNTLVSFAAKINHQPPTPQESQPVLLRQRDVWANAISRGTAAAGLGANEGRGQAISEIPDDLVTEIATKIRGNGLRTGKELLLPDGPFGDEQAAFRTLSPGFFRFADQKRQYYTASERWFKLTGRRQDPGAGDLNLFDRPDAHEATVNNFSDIFPELQEIQAQASAVAGAEATGEAARIEEERKLDPSTRIALEVDRTGGPVLGSASIIGEKALELIDNATGHLLSSAITFGDEKLNGLIPYQQVKGAVVRWALQGLPQGADAEEVWSRILDDHPDVEPARLREVAGREVFRIHNLTEALPSLVKDLTGLDLPAMLATDQEGFVRGLSTWTGFFENPASALLGLGAIRGVRRKIGTEIAFQREATRRQALRHLDDVPEMANVAADLRSKMLDRTIKLMRKGARDVTDMKELTTKLVDRMAESGIALSPQAIGTFRFAMERLNRLEDQSAATGIRGRRGLKQATVNLEREITPPDIFQSAFILDEANRSSINPRSSSVVVEEVNRLMQEYGSSVDLSVESLERRISLAKDNRQFVRVRNAIRTRMATNETRATSHKRLSRARSIGKDLELESEQILKAHKETLTDIQEHATLQLAEHNQGLRTAAGRAVRLEHEGGTIAEVNPQIKSKRYKTVARLTDNIKLSENFLFSVPVKRTIDTAHTGRLRLNKRGIASVGGPELLKRVQEIVNESLEETGRISDVAKREAALEVSAVAADAARLIEDPVFRDIPISSAPRSKALSGILTKIDETIKKNEPAELTPAELVLLNEYRPRKAQLNPKFKEHNAALLKTLSDTKRDVAKETSFRERLNTMIDDLNQVEPGTAGKLPIPRRLGEEIVRRLEEDTTGLVYDKKVGFAISSNKILKGHLELWKDMRSKLTDEVRLLRQQVFDFSSFDLASMPLYMQVQISETFASENIRRTNEVLTDTSRIMHELNRKIAPEERILITNSIKEGVVDKRLPADAANYVINEMFDLRKRMLDFDLNIGRISPETYAKWIDERYTHDQYIADPALRARVRESQLSDLSPTEQLAVSVADNRHFKFSRPTDSFWVEWEKKSGFQAHEKGFKDLPAAEKWARENLPEKTKWSANKPASLLEKIVEGLDMDPGKNFGALMERWVKDQARYLWQRGTSMLPDVMSGKEMKALGVTPDNIRRGRAEVDIPERRGDGSLSPESAKQRKGIEYIRVDAVESPHLKGKWVPTEAVAAAAEVFGGQEFLEAQIKGWKKLTKAFKGFNAGVIVSASNNVLSTLKVPFNPGSYVKGWFGNTFYAHNAGFSMFNPLNVRFFMASMAEVAESFAFKRAFTKADLLEGLATKNMVPEVREMLRANLIPAGESLFATSFRETKKIAAGPKALAGEVSDLEARIAKLDPADPRLAAASDKLASKKEALTALTNRSYTEMISSFGERLAEGAKTEIVGKQGSVYGTKAWNNYAVASGDIPFKMATYMKLRRVDGLSAEKAAEVIRSRFQMFHDPQKWNLEGIAGARDVTKAVKELIPGGKSLGGALFLGYKTEQARILLDVVQHSPSTFLSALGAVVLWNSTKITGSGKKLEDFLAGYALEQGTKRNPMSDLIALTRGTFAGLNDDGSLDMVSNDALFGTWFANPHGGLGEKISDMIRSDSTNPMRKLVGDLVGGTVGGLTANNAVFSLIGALLQGQTTRGTPVGKSTTLLDAVSVFTETFAPGWLAGRDGERFVEILKGNVTEIDPLTYEPRHLPSELVRKQIGLRRTQDPWRQVGQALHFHMSGRRTGHEAEWIRMESARDTAHHLVANDAVDPTTGKIDRFKHRIAVRKFAAGRERTVAGPNQTRIPLSELDPRIEDVGQIKDLLKSTSLPKIQNRFNRQSLEIQIKTYASFREANTVLLPAQKAVDRRLRQLMISKVNNGRPSPIDIRTSAFTIQKFKGTLPDDAQRFLNSILDLTSLPRRR